MICRRPLAAASAAVIAVAAAGCGSVSSQAHSTPPPRLPGLATTMVTPGATWAVAVLGGSAASQNNFWQLFVRPARTAAWRLATPPGVASNGGLVLAGLGGGPGDSPVIAAFRPSQDLAFTPLAVSGNEGSTWSAAVLDASLANVPDSLAAAPGGGRLAALTADGEVMQAGRAATVWSRLTSIRSAAVIRASGRCGLTGLTAVSFAPSGVPLLAGTCGRPGAVGIFSYTAGTWQAAAPALPAALAGRRVQVLRLTRTPAGEMALLAATSGRSTDLLVAWARAWTGGTAPWTLSAPLSVSASPASPAGTAGPLRSSGFAASGAAWVLLGSGGAAVIAGSGTGIAGSGTGWHRLPRPPPQTAALAFGPGGGPGGGIDALVARGSRLTDWRLAAGSASWRVAQVTRVPIAYGSSG